MDLIGWLTYLFFHYLFLLIVFFYLSFYSCCCLPILFPFFWYLDFTQIMHVYIMFVFFVIFDFLLNFETAGFEPHFPLLPMPLPNPLNFALGILPLFNDPLFAPADTNFIF